MDKKHWQYKTIPFTGVTKTMLVAYLIKIAPESYSQTIAKTTQKVQRLGNYPTLASLKADMSSMYAVMSKGKWLKQQPLEIQHGLTVKEETEASKTMEKAVKAAVDQAI